MFEAFEVCPATCSPGSTGLGDVRCPEGTTVSVELRSEKGRDGKLYGFQPVEGVDAEGGGGPSADPPHAPSVHR